MRKKSILVANSQLIVRRTAFAMVSVIMLAGCSSTPDVSSKTRQEASNLTAAGKYSQAEVMLSSVIKSMQLKKSTNIADPMQQLAWVYMLDGKYKEAGDYAAKARYAHEQQKDNVVENKILDDYTQAMLLLSEGKYADAEPLFQSAIEARQKQEAPQAESSMVPVPRMASLKLGLGDLQLESGLYKQAEETFKEAVRLAEADAVDKLPRASLVLSEALEHMALCYQANGRYADAEVVAKRGLKLAKEASNEFSPQYLIAANNLMSVYGAQQKFGKVDDLVKAVWAHENQTFREDHPEILRSKLLNMTTLYHVHQEVDAQNILSVYDRLIDSYSQVYGSDNVHMIAPNQSAGEYALSIGDYTKAETYLRSALTLAKEKLRPNHPRTISILDSLALTLGYKGIQTRSTADLTEAKKLVREAIAKEDDSLPSDNPLRARSLGILGSIYAISDDNEGAYKTFHEYFGQVKKVTWEEPLERVRFIKNFQNVLGKLGKQSEFKQYESLPIPGVRAADSLGSSRELLGSSSNK